MRRWGTSARTVAAASVACRSRSITPSRSRRRPRSIAPPPGRVLWSEPLARRTPRESARSLARQPHRRANARPDSPRTGKKQESRGDVPGAAKTEGGVAAGCRAAVVSERRPQAPRVVGKGSAANHPGLSGRCPHTLVTALKRVLAVHARGPLPHVANHVVEAVPVWRK